ncbi:MAG TPA: xanthine dehydrogenase family protein molybdopterin-binding subunit [Candidatus Dormibacteraeota bacterium]|nr:xanthine dehydrogenase family protein molybdopterin-binding subunit [Candidatus Dormibacteraeota bacterium]
MSVPAAGRRRQEGSEKVTGATRFTADLELAGLSYVNLIVSHVASGRIRRIETFAARSLPGVIDVVTGPDLPELDSAGPDLPLAVESVFYAGQPVVAVIAESEAVAADAAMLVEVEYDETSPVTEVSAAMRDDAPIVLDVAESADDEDASIHGASAAADAAPEARPRNVTGVAHLKRGDVEAALGQAAVVINETYRFSASHHSFMETHVATVRPEPDGGMTIWTSTQGPFVVRDTVTELHDLAPRQVRVIPMPVGGGFGGKIELLEPLLSLLAMRVHRPVRLALPRSQEFVVGHPAPAAEFALELGARSDGTLVALRVRFHYDNGATAGWHAGLTATFLGGTYRIPNFDVRGLEVTTNKTPVDAYRAPGATQAFFALESAMDELAVKLNIDPIQLRLLNVSREGDPTADGRRWPRIASTEVLEEARKHPVYTAPLGPNEAVGVALGAWGGARTPSAAGCRVEPDGTVAVTVGSPDISGTATGLAIIAAQAFGVSPDRVRVDVADTSSAPFSATSSGSQVTYSLGGAVIEAAQEARRQLLEIATEELEAAQEDLDIVDGRVAVRGAPSRSVEITQLVKLGREFMGTHKPIEATGRSAVQAASPSFTVHIARASFDRETGAYKLTGYAAIQDVGHAINPPEIEGQVQGGATQSLGRALGEQLVHDADGQLKTASFLDYEVPAADQIPNIDVRLVEVPSPVGPLGAKGVGEPPAIPGTAALANAVSRASGVRVREVPIDRWNLVRSQSDGR